MSRRSVLVAIGVAALVLAEACGRTAGVDNPERCNGLDDDLDGLVDEASNGSPLSTSCPLTRGVCSAARSYCVDGGWAACDYGPDYQRTERRCDGLDNDCDGRVDRSWARVVVEYDGGPGTSALYTMNSTFFEALPDRVLAMAPAKVVTLDLDLERIGPDLGYPGAVGFSSQLVATPGGWLALTQAGSPTGSCLEARDLSPDGGWTRDADGGLVEPRRVCIPRGFPRFDATSTTAGVVAVLTEGWCEKTIPVVVTWALFAADGGLEMRRFDAGTVNPDWTNVAGMTGRGEFLVRQSGMNDGDSAQWVLPLDGSALLHHRTYTNRVCHPDNLRRRGVACGRWTGSQWLTTWFDALDRVAISDWEGFEAWSWKPADHRLAWRRNDAAWVAPDGGPEQFQLDLVVFDGGAPVPVARFAEPREFQPEFVTEVGGRLLLVSVLRLEGEDPDGLTHLDAEYVCLP